MDMMRHCIRGVLFGLVALVLVAGSAVGTWMAIVHLPGIVDPSPDYDKGDPNVTWLGHGTGAAYGFGLLLLFVIYIVKQWINRFALSGPMAICWFCLGVVCSLPYIWFFVVLDWWNPHVNRVSCWIYDPIAIWFVPTGSFAWDFARGTPYTVQVYLLRSVLEIVVIIPIWLVFWVFVSFFLLGGGWI